VLRVSVDAILDAIQQCGGPRMQHLPLD